MALCKFGFIIDYYGLKLELFDNFWSLPYKISTKPMKQLMGYLEKSIYGLK